MFRRYQLAATEFQTAFEDVLDRLVQLEDEAAQARRPDARLSARRGPKRADDLVGEERIKVTAILTASIRNELRDEVRRRELLGDKADVSSLIREGCRLLLEDVAEPPQIHDLDLTASGRRRAI